MDHNKLWNILKEMAIPDHLPCLPRNLYAGQEATVRPQHGTTDWFKFGKGVYQSCILSPGLFNLHAEYIMWNAGLDDAWDVIKIAWRNINNSDMQMIPPLWQNSGQGQVREGAKWKGEGWWSRNPPGHGLHVINGSSWSATPCQWTMWR